MENDDSISKAKGKTFKELTLEELADIHLSEHAGGHYLSDGILYSGLGYLVQNIRSASHKNHARFFSPLYGSFALLDQVGGIYVNKALPRCGNDNASGIKKALYYFGSMTLDSPEMLALYGLRNALVHDGSMVSRGRYDTDKKQWRGPYYRFVWNSDLAQPVKLPVNAWDGSFSSAFSDDNITEINVEKICELAIEAVRNAKTAISINHLGIEVKEGKKELYHKYMYFVKH